MSRILARLRNEPAVVIGVIAAAVMAGLQYASGAELVSADVVASVGRFFDNPTTAEVPLDGWGTTIVVGIITRFFVSPASKPGV